MRAVTRVFQYYHFFLCWSDRGRERGREEREREKREECGGSRIHSVRLQPPPAASPAGESVPRPAELRLGGSRRRAAVSFFCGAQGAYAPSSPRGSGV